MEPQHQTGSAIFIYLAVFVVISLVASLNEFLIGDLAGRSDRARVKSQLTSLKTAFLSYKGHLKNYPFAGKNPFDASAYARVWKHLYTDETDGNILFSNFVPTIEGEQCTLGLTAPQYKSRWKGPYLMCETQVDSLVDAWGNPIAYYCLDDGRYLRIFLHSAGEDGKFDMARPELAALATELENYKVSRFSRMFQLSNQQMLNADSSDYQGDDLRIQIDQIRKPRPT